MTFDRDTALDSVTNPVSRQTCWGYKVGGGNETDPELPCPQNPYENYNCIPLKS